MDVVVAAARALTLIGDGAAARPVVRAVAPRRRPRGLPSWVAVESLCTFDEPVAGVVMEATTHPQPSVRHVAATVIGWLQEFGTDRLTIALDTRQDAAGVWQLPVHGWTETAEATLDQLATQYAQAGLQHLLCTDIARDGMLSGPNMGLYAHLRALAPQLQVQVSGGARNLADVAAAKAAGCAGIVLGKALLEGHLDLKDALAC